MDITSIYLGGVITSFMVCLGILAVAYSKLSNDASITEKDLQMIIGGIICCFMWFTAIPAITIFIIKQKG